MSSAAAAEVRIAGEVTVLDVPVNKAVSVPNMRYEASPYNARLQ